MPGTCSKCKYFHIIVKEKSTNKIAICISASISHNAIDELFVILFFSFLKKHNSCLVYGYANSVYFSDNFFKYTFPTKLMTFLFTILNSFFVSVNITHDTHLHTHNHHTHSVNSDDWSLRKRSQWSQSKKTHKIPSKFGYYERIRIWCWIIEDKKRGSNTLTNLCAIYSEEIGSVNNKIFCHMWSFLTCAYGNGIYIYVTYYNNDQNMATTNFYII